MKISHVLPAMLLACSAAFVPTQSLHATTKPSPRLDPQALALLKQMSTTLASAKAFTCHTRSILEVPAATGQFVTFFASGEVSLKRPNKLAGRMGGEAPHFDFYYDGNSVSAYAPGTGVYSTLKAPPTIDTMLPGLQAETGIRFPIAPLLYTDPYASLTRGIFSAAVVGSSNVNGIACTHLAFRSPGVNWEIWIESGGRHLPRRLATTFTDRPNFPRGIITFSRWDINPWFLGNGRFVFHKPAGSKEIPFVSVMRSADR